MRVPALVRVPYSWDSQRDLIRRLLNTPVVIKKYLHRTNSIIVSKQKRVRDDPFPDFYGSNIMEEK
jgi:hypothetical protein